MRPWTGPAGAYRIQHRVPGGVDTANAVTVKLGDAGKACIYTLATAHVLADVDGHVTA